MFYSHEVLTSRKYGVATVWLVATLGSKSTLKKVSRKAILDVDVGKACETIVAPDAPMALRLQSSLLYGITRVYAQQCGYVLHDAESARNSMRALTKMMHQAALAPEGVHKATAAQLNLQDDPNFLPDMDLFPMDLDSLETNFMIEDATQSVLSPDNSQLTLGSQQSIGGLMIPSNSSVLGRSMDGVDLLGTGGGSSRAARMGPPQVLEDDLDLFFEPNGLMNEAPSREARAPSGRADRTTPASAGRGNTLQYDDDDMQIQTDDDGFMLMQDDSGLGDGLGSAQQQEQESVTEQAAAPLTKRTRKPKTLPVDISTTLRNSQLSIWIKDYPGRMHEQSRVKQATKMTALAKKNAEHWFLGAGSLLGQGMRGPLDMFSSAKLLEAFTGVDILNPGKKRAREEEDSSQHGAQKRSRGEVSSDEIARGLQSYDNDMLMADDDMPIINDDTIEQGREAPTPLDDRHLSSLFPWNQSAGSRQLADAHVISASFGGGPQLYLNSRRGSRLTSASPLVGRGVAIPDVEDGFQFGGSDIPMGGLTGDEEFELYGPAAQVDTQTAAQTQWQRAALGAESANFLTFLQTAIDEEDLAREEAGAGDEEYEALDGSVDFETILPPESNSQMVAAQALLHVLALGTKGLIKVAQDEHFGPINMRVVAAAA